MLTTWLRALHDDCNFKIKFKTLDKEYYSRTWEENTLSINPIKAPEFFCKNVSLGTMENELKSMYVEALIENAGYKQPHEFILSGILFSNNKYFLSFTQEYSNWPVSRLVIFDEYNHIIRNDFKTVYNLSWEDYREEKYQPKKKKIIASVPKGLKGGKPILAVEEKP